jgi:hypothetical protein
MSYADESKALKRVSDNYSDIYVGARVTVVDRFGKEHSGRAVMLGPAGWVLNMGGAHGRPQIASMTNFVRVVVRPDERPAGIDRRFDARDIDGEGDATPFPNSWRSEIKEMLERAGVPDAHLRADQLVRGGVGPEEVRHSIQTGQWEHLAQWSPGIHPARAGAAETGAEDYVAVSPQGQRVAGPFKNYFEAKLEADKAGGYVQYAFERGAANEAGQKLIGDLKRGDTVYIDEAEWTVESAERLEHSSWCSVMLRGTGDRSDALFKTGGWKYLPVSSLAITAAGAREVAARDCSHVHPPSVPSIPCKPIANAGKQRRAAEAGRPRKRGGNDAFTNAYIDAALWSSMDNSNDAGGDPLDENYDVSDIAPTTLVEMQKDAAAFQEHHAKLLAEAYKHKGYDEARAGHDFWLTRNGHGAGFWDRGLGKVGDELTKAAKAYGSYDLYVGDAGQIYGNEPGARSGAGEVVPVVYEAGAREAPRRASAATAKLAAEASSSKMKGRRIGHEAADIGSDAIGGCLPWVKVTKDPERYETCLARANKLGPMDTPEKICKLLEPVMSKEDQEVFLVVLTDIRGQLRGVSEIARGQRSRVAVDTVDILRAVVVSGAEGFTVCHQHPSGNPKPSQADKDLTRAIAVATAALNGGPDHSGVTFLDHVVLGGKGKFYSIREHDPKLFKGA